MNIEQKLENAIEHPASWDVPGLLQDAADTIAALLKALDDADEAICQATWERKPKELTQASNAIRAAIKKAKANA